MCILRQWWACSVAHCLQAPKYHPAISLSLQAMAYNFPLALQPPPCNLHLTNFLAKPQCCLVTAPPSLKAEIWCQSCPAVYCLGLRGSIWLATCDQGGPFRNSALRNHTKGLTLWGHKITLSQLSQNPWCEWNRGCFGVALSKRNITFRLGLRGCHLAGLSDWRFYSLIFCSLKR